MSQNNKKIGAGAGTSVLNCGMYAGTTNAVHLNSAKQQNYLFCQPVLICIGGMTSGRFGEQNAGQHNAEQQSDGNMNWILQYVVNENIGR